MRQLKDILTLTAQNLDAFKHPRVSLAWQDCDMVFRRVHNPSPDLKMDITGKRVEDFYEDKDHAARVTAQKRQVLESGQPYHDVVAITLGGKKHLFDVSVEPTYDDKGKIDGLITITIDVTDLVQAREQLNEANKRLVRLLGETLDDGPKTRHPSARVVK